MERIFSLDLIIKNEPFIIIIYSKKAKNPGKGYKYKTPEYIGIIL